MTPPNTKEEAIEMFREKVNELKREQFPDKVHEFGYKVLIENELFTVTDWGNVESFLQELWDRAYREGYNDGLDFGIVKKWNPQPTAK